MLRMHFVVVVAGALSACTHSGTTVTSPAPTKGKPSAPVAVTAQLGERSARVSVAFQADAKDVAVSVHGVDGLVVEGNLAPVQGGAFARGEASTFEVALQRPVGRSSLVVSVKGDFGAGTRARVVAFTLGEGLEPTAGEVMTTDDGDTVRVMPAAQ